MQKRLDRLKYHSFSIVVLSVFLVLVVLLLSIPLFYLILTSFEANGVRGLTLLNYRRLFQSSQAMQSLVNSLSLSLRSSLIAMGLAIPCAMSMLHLRGERLQRHLLLLVNLRASFHGAPLVLAAGLTVGIGGVLARLYALMGEEYNFLLASQAGLLGCYVYFQLPLAVLLLYPIFQGIRSDWQQAAAMLGAYPRQFWLRIGLPITLPSLFTSFAVLFAHAMGAYATAYLLNAPDYPILPLVISAHLTSGRFANPGLGSAMAILLAAALVMAMLLGEWAGSLAVRGRRET
ncbi:MAG TPA: ABC transporter permease [Clostridia bacterium]|nr:ABC transporter permease [Clostridia bacterium]